MPRWVALWSRLSRSFPARVIAHTHRDDAPVVAGGVALFLLLGLLPTLAAVVSIYALIAEPSDIRSHLAGLDRVVPGAVFDLVVEQLERATRRSSDELGLTVAGSVIVALYSARASAGAVLTGIEHVDGAPPRWRGWRRLLLTLAIALGTIAGTLTLLLAVVAVPATSATLGPNERGLLYELRWPVLIAIGVISLSVLYGLGAPRRRLRLVVPGALVATALGLLASLVVSYYVTELAGYRSLYGAFGGAMAVLLWFYAVSLAVLIGAVVNTELDPSTPT